MAVVINEFEVVAEPAANQRRGAETSAQPAPPPPPEPREIASALRALAVHSLRTWAH